jgi:molybdopterin-guanine dinucleotide biosynthesis protein A
MRLGSIILAGGKSNRMGKPKASLPFADSTLLGQAVDTLLTCTYPVAVVARDADDGTAELPPVPLEADIIHDAAEHQGCGPLAGLHAGLLHVSARCDAAFVTGCDAPFVTPAVVEWLAEQLGDQDLVMPEVGGVLQPLCAIYHTRIGPAVRKLLAATQRSLHALTGTVDARILKDAEVSAFDPEHRFLRGVNSPEEYEAVLRELEKS